jgi:hypothetical protein
MAKKKGIPRSKTEHYFKVEVPVEALKRYENQRGEYILYSPKDIKLKVIERK